jgi:hypothetical protein
MYSGFVTKKKVVTRIGIHQRFDMAGYRMVEDYFAPETFPPLKQVLHFEGLNGPDGLKVKSPGEDEPSHIYDPIKDIGDVPQHISNHYTKLIKSLRDGDLVRAAFEAGWLAHYITDGLTPAHHFPYEEHKEELFGKASEVGFIRKNWAWWGRKGVFSTHINFEMGVASALLLFPIKVHLDDQILASARRMGYLQYFKQEATAVAQLKLYHRFYAEGWTVGLAKAIRDEVAPRAARAIGIIWLLAYLEAGFQQVATGSHEAVVLQK